jgi:metallo-beta-lactamase family protein
LISSELPQITHHGGAIGVTGSCHELHCTSTESLLIDCGLFQGDDYRSPEIEFSVAGIRALIVTHVHLDHVGRIPYLIAAGFSGPIYCSPASAVLLPAVLEDAIKVGVTRNERLVHEAVRRIQGQVVVCEQGVWLDVETVQGRDVAIKLQPAGHILGSSYVQIRLAKTSDQPQQRVVFSGDLGAPYTPLLAAPRSPYSADVLVLESTYGDRVHQQRRQRRQQLRQIIERSFENRGVVLIPAFSIGRTQELLYEIEDLIHRFRHQSVAKGLVWDDVEVVVDSPLAADFTQMYTALRPLWDKEARSRLRRGRHPLSFEQITTIADHQDHLQTVGYLTRKARPCIVIAASGMCSGGRIVNYLKALLADERTDVVFVGYQAHGTPGRDIQRYGSEGGYVVLDGQRYDIRAAVHTLSGYSAHADQTNLLNFVRRMRRLPQRVILVHGEREARVTLRNNLIRLFPNLDVVTSDESS